MLCTNQTEYANHCSCSQSCSRRGKCCACIKYHKGNGELPACYFTAEYEKTCDRSVTNYLKMIDNN
jgi:hypothetical protein